MKLLVLALVAGCSFTAHGGLYDPDAAPVAPDAAHPSVDAMGTSIDAALPPDAASASCQPRQLVAWRTYGLFPLYGDGSVLEVDGKLAVLPAELPITGGNASNHCARITFQNDLISTTQCIYKGGASQAHVGNDPIEIAAGQKYTLQHCKSGVVIFFDDCGGIDIGAEEPLAAGDEIPFHALTVRVDDGDDQQGATQVSVGVDVCDL
jgi:hypothetical protein